MLCSSLSVWTQTPGASAPGFDRVAAQAAEARAANRIDQAIALYREALHLRPKWGEGWFYLATLLYDRDRYEEASRAFRETTALDPKVGTAWVMLGLCEFKLGRYDEALKSIRQGRQIGITNNPQLRNVMLYHEGLLLLHQGDFETAQQTLGLLGQEGVKNEDLIVALGLSVLHLRPASLLQADSSQREIVPRAGGAEYLAAQKKFDQALSAYEHLARDFPQARGVQYAYGRYLLTSNHDERAIAAFQREIENDPKHLLSHLRIADTKLRLRDARGGLPYAEEAVKLRPQLPLGHYLLGSLLLDAGQTARSITELETARRLMPDEPRIYFALGRAYARANRHEDAARARATFARLEKQVREASQKANP